MAHKLSSNRKPFRELLQLIDEEYDILRQECDQLRSKSNVSQADLGRDLTMQERTDDVFTLSLFSASSPTSGRAKDGRNQCQLTPTAVIPLVGAPVTQPNVLKAATEDGPVYKGLALTDTCSNDLSDRRLRLPPQTDHSEDQNGHAPSDVGGAKLSCHAPSDVGGAKLSLERSRTSLFRNIFPRQSSMFCSTNPSGIEKPKASRVRKAIDHIKRNQDSEGPDGSLLSESIFVRVANDRIFLNMVVDGIVAIVIVCNMLYIGIVAEMSESSQMVLGGNTVFASLFLMELMFKLHILGVEGYYCGKDRAWNAFETALSIGAMVEVAFSATGNFEGDVSTPILRIIRLFRIAKIIRVLRLQIFKELMLMVNGVLGGVRTLAWSFVLICVPLYMVAMVLRETAGRLPQDNDSASENFNTVGISFYTMFRCVVGGDCTDSSGRPIFLILLLNHGWQYAAIYIVTLLLMTFGLFNVIVAIYVENTVASAKYNEMVLKHRRLQNEEMFSVKSKELLELVASIRKSTASGDTSVDLLSWQISAEHFQELCEIPRFRDILAELDIAEEDQMDLFETLDVDGGGTLDAVEIINGINKLRGDPRRADIISVSLTLRSMFFSFQQFEAEVLNMFAQHAVSLNDIRASLLKRGKP
eukprot:TRINITY_DN20098_c0_g3_i1.p1 TRINITY_DN20098_c0_g3~~TRINITY_DN20098_c0_g3_i1.p1  ORF type:complete len:642 (-),score=93.87 TRINITY_DN20098_c0_g3_i1:26-1951(-)